MAETKFVGFDISSEQFPSSGECPPNVDFVIHDVFEPFPIEYHDMFDLVNIRFLSYVIKAVDLVKVVSHILQILKPGGYLQWQECDVSDSWTSPETPIATMVINYVVAERIARGLLPAIATPLVKVIQSCTMQVPEGYLNPISWSQDLMRIKHLETVSTHNHPSPAVAAGKKLMVLSVANVLLRSSLSRKEAIMEEPYTVSPENEKLTKEVESMRELIEVIKSGKGKERDNWDFELTWLIARKAMVVKENEAWMPLKYPV